LVENVRGVEIMPGRRPQSPACLSKLIGRRPEIALQDLRDPGDRHGCHGSPAALGVDPKADGCGEGREAH
jgi:hypothetical protein